LEDIGQALVGGYNGDVIAEYLAGRRFNVDLSPNDRSSAQKLIGNRVDYWAVGQFTANVLIKTHGWESVLVPVLSFNRSELYLACHPDFPADAASRLEAALATIRRDGRFQAIDQKYRDWAGAVP